MKFIFLSTNFFNPTKPNNPTKNAFTWINMHLHSHKVCDSSSGHHDHKKYDKLHLVIFIFMIILPYLINKNKIYSFDYAPAAICSRVAFVISICFLPGGFIEYILSNLSSRKIASGG